MEDVKNRLLTLLRFSYIEHGYLNNADIYANELISSGHNIQEIIREIYSENKNEPMILIGLGSLLSHLDFDDIDTIGPEIAKILLELGNCEISEYGIRCFENWGVGVDILESHKSNVDWLEEYRLSVIDDLKDATNGNLKTKN